MNHLKMKPSVVERFVEFGGLRLLRDGDSVEEILHDMGEGTNVWTFRRALAHPHRRSIAELIYKISNLEPLPPDQDPYNDYNDEEEPITVEITGEPARQLRKLSEQFGWRPEFLVEKALGTNLRAVLLQVAEEIMDGEI